MATTLLQASTEDIEVITGHGDGVYVLATWLGSVIKDSVDYTVGVY